jgi:hypothetical protein
MNALTVEATVQIDGELHLTRLPLRKGDRVEAVLRSVPPSAAGGAHEPGEGSAAESERAAARAAFLELARASQFRSTGPYPAREALHERD